MVVIASKKYVEYLEKEVDFWRVRAEDERKRGDRLSDQLLVMNGQAPVSEDVILSEREKYSRLAGEFTKRDREMEAIFSDINSDIIGEETEEEDSVSEQLERLPR